MFNPFLICRKEYYNMIKPPPICVALDYTDENPALAMVHKLKTEVMYYKIGLQLYISAGPKIIQEIKDMGSSVFLDLKFHDIPAQVEKACYAAARLGADLLTIHAFGGMEMMKAAKSGLVQGARDNHIESCPLLIAVTILTSLSTTVLQKELKISLTAKDAALHLAKLAKESNCDGMVCSAKEVQSIRKQVGDNFFLITPGIRLPEDLHQDQKRIATPKDALNAGSNLLVIGRPITASDDPLATVQRIKDSLS